MLAVGISLRRPLGTYSYNVSRHIPGSLERQGDGRGVKEKKAKRRKEREGGKVKEKEGEGMEPGKFFFRTSTLLYDAIQSRCFIRLTFYDSGDKLKQ